MAEKRAQTDKREQHYKKTTDYRVESVPYVEPPTPEAIEQQRERQLGALRMIREKVHHPQREDEETVA